MLARRYFSAAPASQELDYHVTVVRNRIPHTVVYASHPLMDGVPVSAIDATAQLLGIRWAMSDLGAMTTTKVTPPTGQAGSPPIRQVIGVTSSSSSNPSEYWQLRVVHRAGSLETLAAQTRRQNLLASLTILALLTVGFVLMLVALRRARALTRQKMDFVAGVSHELRTPIAVVAVAGANLADGLVTDPEQVRHYGRLIQREGRRLTQMTEHVLSFAQIEEISLSMAEPAGAEVLILEAVGVMQAQLDELSFTVSVSVKDSSPPVLVDRLAIGRAIQNLISNAIKYSAEHREIRITAGAEVRRGNPRVFIAVEDDGIGIQPDELSLIFEPFRRGRAAIERNLPGTGLGLSLVRSIMRVHGGEVVVRSEPAVGSTFVLYLPSTFAPDAGQSTKNFEGQAS
jgi:signal transduction histidine kinase